MVKAINKQVLEIKDTGCECFEKAIFFISPQYMGDGDEKLRKNALRIIQNSGDFPKSKKQVTKNRLAYYGKMAVSAIVGAGTSALIMYFL